MNINSNFSTKEVTGTSPTKPVVKRNSQSVGSVSLDGSSALDAALGAVPDVRPEAVDRAKQLINDPNYPSQDVIKKLSSFLAQNLSSQQI
jgi:hypothetical protein